MILKKHAESVSSGRRAAFTLMEMLVVVAIIVVLAGVGGTYLIGQLNNAKIDTARLKAKTVANACDQFLLDNNQYPPTLEVLLQRNQDGRGPYLKGIDDLRDPWGNVFQYDQAGSRNQADGAVVQVPDVYCVIPGDGRSVGNFKGFK